MNRFLNVPFVDQKKVRRILNNRGRRNQGISNKSLEVYRGALNKFAYWMGMDGHDDLVPWLTVTDEATVVRLMLAYADECLKSQRDVFGPSMRLLCDVLKECKVISWTLEENPLYSHKWSPPNERRK